MNVLHGDVLVSPSSLALERKQGLLIAGCHGRDCSGQIEGKKAAPFQWITFTYQFNMTGQPAATVPAGFTKDGLPIGLQIVGRHLDDALVLRAAAAYEAAAPWKDKWPPMLVQMGL
jgi:aspartyl-tRNA(Asn)/glutamyl-tRNA(Gln) amidotransferase subunit A